MVQKYHNTGDLKPTGKNIWRNMSGPYMH